MVGGEKRLSFSFRQARTTVVNTGNTSNRTINKDTLHTFPEQSEEDYPSVSIFHYSLFFLLLIHFFHRLVFMLKPKC